jgi:hypothetical protein
MRLIAGESLISKDVALPYSEGDKHTYELGGSHIYPSFTSETLSILLAGAPLPPPTFQVGVLGARGSLHDPLCPCRVSVDLINHLLLLLIWW